MSNLSPRSVPSRLRRKQKVPLKKGKVLRMISAMDRTAKDAEEFFTSGRTGRRNAMADILGIHAKTSTADMPAKLQALTTSSANEGTLPGSSRNMDNSDNLTQNNMQAENTVDKSLEGKDNLTVNQTDQNSTDFNNT